MKISDPTFGLPGDFSDQQIITDLWLESLMLVKSDSSCTRVTLFASLGNHDVDSHHDFSLDHLYLGRRLFSDFPCEEKPCSTAFMDPVSPSSINPSPFLS